MLLLAIYPLLLIFICGFSLFSRRKVEEGELHAWAHGALFLSFLMPWVLILSTIIKGTYPDWTIGISHLTKNADLWLLSTQAMFALVLLILRRYVESQEAWFKATISLFLGALFLELSLHPSLGLGFPISTDLAQIIAAVSFIVGVFLLFGLPPLQLGMIDLGSEKSTSRHIYINVLPRYALGFVILFTMNFAKWLGDLEYLQGLIAAAIFIGVALTRLVLRLQTNVFRTLAYLSSGFSLSIATKILFPEFGDLIFFVQVLFTLPLLMQLNEQAGEASRGTDLQSWLSFRVYRQASAQRLHFAVKAFLYMECAVAFAMAASLAMSGQWLIGLTALAASFSALVVTQDKQAFAPHAAA